MRTLSMLIVLVFSLFVSGCNDSAKVDELTKTNAALATELQECRVSKQNAATQQEVDKEEAESFKKYKSFNSNGPKF